MTTTNSARMRQILPAALFAATVVLGIAPLGYPAFASAEPSGDTREIETRG